MRKKVMVFSGGSYPGVEICRALRNNLLYRPVLASSYSDHSRFIADEYLEGLPFTNDEKFAEKLNKIIDDNDIEFIIPTHDTIALTLMENAPRLHAIIVCSPLETTRLCRYKALCYAALEGEAYTPAVFDSPADVPDSVFPVIIKPDEGQGTRGVIKAETRAELEQAYSETEAPVICEYLPGEEYTIDCFTDSKRNLIFCNPRRRAKTMNGISSRAENVENEDELVHLAKAVNEKLHFRGYWFIQCKKDKSGNLKLLELCTRFAGTFNHSQAFGVNLPLLALCDFSGKEAAVIKNNYKVISDKTYIDRFEIDYDYKRVYVDYDDTVTENGGEIVNPFVMAYLYKCRAKKIELILLTRHGSSKSDSLQENMRKLAVPESLFDEIIELDWNDKKENHIKTDVPAILLDNSFAERKAVAEKCRIPVFDVCHVDCLFDWR